MPVYAFDHIHLRSPDPEATAAWYQDILGADIIRSVHQGQPRIDLKLGGQDIFIAPVVAGDGVAAPPTPPYQGLDHFGLAVQGIDAVVAALQAKGVHFTMLPREARPGLRIAFLRGPENVSIELLERSPA